MSATPTAAAALKKTAATTLGVDFGFIAMGPSAADVLGFKINGDTGLRSGLGTVSGAGSLFLGDGAGGGESLFRPSAGLWTFSGTATALQAAVLDNAPIAKTASFDFAVADVGRTVLANSAAPLTATIRLNATIGLPVGATLKIRNINTGTVTVAAEGGVTINKPAGWLGGMAGQFGTNEYYQRAIDVWELVRSTDVLGLDGRYVNGALDTDITLAANSDTRVASQKAIKAFIAALPTLASSDTVVLPINTLGAVTTLDVSNLQTRIPWIGPALCVAVGALATCTYANGTAGVGATLTSTTNNAFPAADGVTIALNDRILVAGQVSSFQNGPYTLTQQGTGGQPWILTRDTACDQAAEMFAGIQAFVAGGTVFGGTRWYLTATVGTVGTDAAVWATQNLGVGGLRGGQLLGIPFIAWAATSAAATDTSMARIAAGVLSLGTGAFVDNGFALCDNGDNTKQLAFELSGLTTATTRTITLPDASGTLVLAAATQTLANKTLQASCTYVAQDNALSIVDNGDNTKVMKFECSGITTGTTRTLTVPDASDTLVLLALAQTLTNKTMTSPVLNTPTITLNVPAIKTVDYTLVLGDASALITTSKASAITVTIPANASVAFPIGTIVWLSNVGAGTMTLAITTDTLGGNVTFAANKGGYAIKTAVTTWRSFVTA